ncbi:hypothetical protein [Aeromonas veronii]|uniref:hypothetical protein n=1 Tax=Aeromonas veronii TaxID=654 RepID=UPI00191E8529|nr:hypothetical protein [Aeromonas veronii]MBL0506240.1 hypothetical protein [Aeromonas veronii]HDX8349215.1 hypothetical protein [Aeromonas veronii]
MTIEEAIANNIGSVITGSVAILTSCITAGVAVWVSSINHNRAVAEAKRKESIERLENLYINFENWSSSHLIAYANIIDVFNGVPTVEKTIKSVDGMKIKPIDCDALIRASTNLYYKGLLSTFEKVISQRLTVSQLLTDGKIFDSLEQFITEKENFDKVCIEFKISIVAEMDKLTK